MTDHYMGQPLDTMSVDELRDAVRELARQLYRAHADAGKVLDTWALCREARR